MKIEVRNKEERQKAVQEGTNQALLVFQGEYEPGDRIVVQVPAAPQYYVIRLDDTMDEELVYLTKSEISYQIPFEEKKASYNPKCFTGDLHYLTIRKAEAYEINSYRNIAKNVWDQHGDTGYYPHAFANVETRGEAVFAARNAIDGVRANTSHGIWPYASWGINRQEDAELTLEFGRPVDFDQIVITTRADFPHDNWWTSAVLTCSDGSAVTIALTKQEEPQVIRMTRKAVTWIKLGQLIKADDPSPFPALTQIEIYGTESI